MCDRQDDIIKSDKNPLDDDSGLDEVFQSFEYTVESGNVSYFDLFKEVYSDFRYALHSNAGYRTTPLFKEQNVDFTGEDIIQIEKPFRILYKNAVHKKSSWFSSGEIRSN